MTIEKQIEYIVESYDGICIYDYLSCLEELGNVSISYKIMLLQQIADHNEAINNSKLTEKKNLEACSAQMQTCAMCQPESENIVALMVNSTVKTTTEKNRRVDYFLRKINARKSDEELDEIYKEMKETSDFNNVFNSLKLQIQRLIVEFHNKSKENNISEDERKMYDDEAEELSVVLDSLLEIDEEDISMRDGSLLGDNKKSKRLVFLTNNNDIPYLKIDIESMSEEMYSYVISALNDIKNGNFSNCKKIKGIDKLFQKRCVKIRLFFKMEPNNVIVVLGTYTKSSELNSVDMSMYSKLDALYMQKKQAINSGSQESIEKNMAYENDIFLHLNKNVRGVGR